MTDLNPSTAGQAETFAYTEGRCHAFALALARRLGWGLLVVTDPLNPHWEDEADADNAIPSVTHVYALDGDGMAWDVLGSRPVAAVEAELRELFPAVAGYDEDVLSDPSGLDAYVAASADDFDRPLEALADGEVDAAWLCAERVLADVPGFPGGGLIPRP